MVDRDKILSVMKNKFFIAAVAVVVLLLIVAGISSEPQQIVTDGGVTFKARRGYLTISVTESGTIKARHQVILKSQVEGRTTILSLVPEGTKVKQGDLLVELDASRLLDIRIDQEIRVQNADAAFIRATENLAVVENQAESDVDKAELALNFAKQDLRKYVEGEYPNELTEAQAKITLAEEELVRANEKLKWSKKLSVEKYISQTELQGDELAAKRKDLEVELAKNNLSLLKNFTNQREMSQLQSDVHQADMALKRTIRKAKSDVIQAKADLRAKKSEFNRQQDKLDKNARQIEKTKIYAPADGLVVYATSAKGSWRGNQEPLAEGQEVREREELIYLPTATDVKAEIKIHESSLKKVKLDLPCRLTVDALPGQTFTGYVAKIAPLPDAQSIWMNPDLKVYNAEIYIDGDGSEMRTGMSCSAEIIIEEYNDAVYIPVQAVLRVGGKPTIYVANRRKFEPREVKIGLDNNRMIHILEGLDQGQEVLLTPPLAEAERQYADSNQGSYQPAKKHSSEEPAEQNKPRKPRGRDRRDGKKRGQQDQRSRQRNQNQQPTQGPDSTPDQAQKMRQQYENMSEEEKQKAMQQMRQKFENMSDEEKKQMRQRWQQGGSQ